MLFIALITLGSRHEFSARMTFSQSLYEVLHVYKIRELEHLELILLLYKYFFRFTVHASL